MASYKIYAIFLLLILTQSICCRPVDESSEKLQIEEVIQKIKANGTDLEKLVLSNMGNYLLFPQKYASDVVNASKHLLEDETLLENKQTDVLEFKKKLSLLLHKYDPSASLKSIHGTMDYFFSIIQPYFELTEDKQTPASEFIKDLLKKYNFSKFSMKMEELEKKIDKYRVTGDIKDKLGIFTLDSLITVPQQNAANATNATRYLLKDEAFKAMDQTEVLQLKKKLTVFLDKYDPSTSNIKSIYKSMDAFANITDHYFKLPVEKVTEESKLIIELLNKLKFIVKFEEHKEDLGPHLLHYLEKITNLTEWQEQMESMDEFVDIFELNIS